MAAKQGLTAHLSQAGEDAKRAVLSRAGVSWFSNLNTLMTIKSAPPKTPEVLQLLSIKSGWLFKRNEQHVWQARWCAVVPHMFLYYFDAAGEGDEIPQPSPAQQEEWNAAVANGYRGRKQHEKRSNFYLFHHNNNSASTGDAAEADTLGVASPPNVPGEGAGAGKLASSLQPAGIIDLECYTNVHRSKQNQLVMELSGDDQVNPDLRNFYFCASNDQESEDWTSALLNGRHAALQDECEAYKQVCDGFAQQLQQLHADLDAAQGAQEASTNELYHLRSAEEASRRQCWRLLSDALEKPAPEHLEGMRADYRAHLERARQQDLGVSAAIQLLMEYIGSVEEQSAELKSAHDTLQHRVDAAGADDQAKVAELQQELVALKQEFADYRAAAVSEQESLEARYRSSQKELQDVQNELSSAKLEATMFSSQQKNKMQLLNEHKRILKKEVIDLRSKLEDTLSELSKVKHQHESAAATASAERQKAALLERYVDKIESQVKVQQNMMELMSHAASVSGSLAGGVVQVKKTDGTSRAGHSSTPSDDDVVAERLTPIRGSYNYRRSHSSALDDSDNKSHMSELTEDRTQRHFEQFVQYSQAAESPRMAMRKLEGPAESPRNLGPPSYIIGGEEQPDEDLEQAPLSSKLDTIHSSAASLPPSSMRYSTPRLPRHEVPRSGQSVGPGERLSVAQRARLEADRQSTPVRIRADDEKVLDRLQKNKNGSGNSVNSGNSGLWRRMEEAVLGPRPEEDMFSDSGSSGSVNSTRVTDYTEGDDEEEEMRRRRLSRSRLTASALRHGRRHQSARSDAGASDVSEEKKVGELNATNLSLQERSKLQRAKQLQFLKEQGLIKGEEDVKGGAGASPAKNAETSSVTSTSISYPTSSVSFPGAKRGSARR